MNGSTSTDDKLMRAIALLPPFCKRGQCVAVLELAGFSGWKIKQSMKLLTKHFPLGCKYARYRRHEFLAAFQLVPGTDSMPKAGAS